MGGSSAFLAAGLGGARVRLCGRGWGLLGGPIRTGCAVAGAWVATTGASAGAVLGGDWFGRVWDGRFSGGSGAGPSRSDGWDRRLMAELVWRGRPPAQKCCAGGGLRGG